MLIEPLGTHFSEILIKIHINSFNKMDLKIFRKWRSFCRGLNVSSCCKYARLVSLRILQDWCRNVCLVLCMDPIAQMQYIAKNLHTVRTLLCFFVVLSQEDILSMSDEPIDTNASEATLKF